MALLVLTIGLLFLLILEVWIFKKIYAPPVILSMVFMGGYILIEIAYGKLENTEWFYSCYFIAAVVFFFGFFLSTRNMSGSIAPTTAKVWMSKNAYIILLLCSYLISGTQIFRMIPLIIASSVDPWTTVRNSFESSSVDAFLNLFVVVFLFTSVCIFFMDASKMNKRRMIMTLPCIVPVLLSVHRGEWFMIIITIVFLWIYIKRPQNSKTIKIGALCAGTIIGIVAVSSMWKYRGIFQTTNELAEYVSRAYFSTQFVAFRMEMEAAHQLRFGQNTFRFIIAVLNRIGIIELKPLNIVQPFVTIYGQPTNVYTGLSYYAMDFGMFWAYIMEFLFGVLYGVLYKKAINKKDVSIFSIIVLSMLMYPLINQFFDDRYLSVCSEWLKYFMFLFLITRSNVVKVMASNE